MPYMMHELMRITTISCTNLGGLCRLDDRSHHFFGGVDRATPITLTGAPVTRPFKGHPVEPGIDHMGAERSTGGTGGSGGVVLPSSFVAIRAAMPLRLLEHRIGSMEFLIRCGEEIVGITHRDLSCKHEIAPSFHGCITNRPKR